MEHTIENEYFLGRVIYDIFSHTLVTIKKSLKRLLEKERIQHKRHKSSQHQLKYFSDQNLTENYCI